MNANHPVRAGGREEAERRREKERKREEKELRKLAKAAGIKLAVPPAVHSATSGSASPAEGKGFRKSGWASVSDALPSSTSATPSSSTPSQDWASVSGPPPNEPPPPPPSAPAQHQGFRSGGWSTLATSVEGPPMPGPSRGGQASVSSPAPPPPPPTASGPPPPVDPCPLPPAHQPVTPSSWSRLPPAPPTDQSDSSTHARWEVKPLTQNTPQSGTTPSSLAPHPPQLQNQPPPPPNQTTPNPSSERKSKSKSKSKMAFDEEATAQSRGNWQSFQKMRGRR